MKLVVAIVVAVAVVGCGSPQTPTAPVVATISIEPARDIALAKVPGTIQHEKFKKSKKAQIYSFKIAPTGATEPGKLTKVEVDAVSGAILKVKDVDPNAKKDKKDKDKNGKGGKDDDDDDDDD